jgi:hypothetical protein
MCLVVYLGVDRKLTKFSDPAIGEVGLEPEPLGRPKALAGKRFVYGVADRVPTGWNCSCIFLDDILPWEIDKGYDPADPETAPREAAYTSLARIARAALEVDSAPLVFSCWSGDEQKEPTIKRILTPEEIRPARYLFDDQLDGGQGGTPPILIRLTDNMAEDTQ